MTQSLTERYDERVVITGTVPVICYAEGMTRYLLAKRIRIFDYPQFAMQLLRSVPQNSNRYRSKDHARMK